MRVPFFYLTLSVGVFFNPPWCLPVPPHGIAFLLHLFLHTFAVRDSRILTLRLDANPDLDTILRPMARHLVDELEEVLLDSATPNGIFDFL